jgi:phosphoserine aminotransferase
MKYCIKKSHLENEGGFILKRVYNFSAGPSVLPEEVLNKAKKQMLNYKNSGMSVMEMSHRSKVYEEIINGAEQKIRNLMNIPKNFKVLFLQGGASSQFSMIPLNLLSNSREADYVDTGMWSTKAIKEAKRYGEIHVVASSKDENYNYIPELSPTSFHPNADYFHITTNNTIFGTRYTKLPNTGKVPLVADMSSNILSEGVNVSNFGLIYAGAQKNMGPAGVVLVIIREDLVGDTMELTPTMFQYKIHVDNDSMYNTPPTYGIYICNLVFEWLESLGGIEAMQKINEEKAGVLYEHLDQSKLFKGTVRKKDRSLMNVPFVTGDENLDNQFIKEATQKGFVNLKGHRSVGGMRASIYNAMPIEGILELVQFMKKFELENR